MGQIIGPYEIIRRLGEGGMGTVDLGRHVETGQTAAIKRLTRLSGPFLDALRREVWSLAKIQHLNIVRIYDHDLDGESPWYAMEYIRGLSLRERLQNTSQHTAIFDSAETHLFEETVISVNLTTLASPPSVTESSVRPVFQGRSSPAHDRPPLRPRFISDLPPKLLAALQD